MSTTSRTRRSFGNATAGGSCRTPGDPSSLSASLAGDAALLAGAVLLVAGVLLAGFAERFRAPGLLLFLGLGMVVGDDGFGLINFADARLAQSIGVVALVVILYEGGLSTPLSELRRVAAPAGVLATLGVVVTAGVVAGGVTLTTDISTHTAVLIGAVVASTDAAAVFVVLRRTPTPRRLTSLLEAESGANDPMAVLLTIGVLATATSDPGIGDWAVFGFRQLLGGLAMGVAVGWAGAMTLRRLDLDSTALYPVLGLGIAGLAYGVSAALGASGFLASSSRSTTRTASSGTRSARRRCRARPGSPPSSAATRCTSPTATVWSTSATCTSSWPRARRA